MPAKIPFKPKEIKEHQEQWDKTRELVFDEESCRLGTSLKTNETPACAFDFEDGIRLFIAREVQMTGRHIIRWCAVVHPSAMQTCQECGCNCTQDTILDRFFELTQIDPETAVEFLGIGIEDGTPFWAVPDIYYEKN